VIDRLTLSVLNRRMFNPRRVRGAQRRAGRLASAALRKYLSLYEASLGDAPPDGDAPRARIQAQVDRLRRAVMAGPGTMGARSARSATGKAGTTEHDGTDAEHAKNGARPGEEGRGRAAGGL
jgi:hypothetical protein